MREGERASEVVLTPTRPLGTIQSNNCSLGEQTVDAQSGLRTDKDFSRRFESCWHLTRNLCDLRERSCSGDSPEVYGENELIVARRAKRRVNRLSEDIPELSESRRGLTVPRRRRRRRRRGRSSITEPFTYRRKTIIQKVLLFSYQK